MSGGYLRHLSDQSLDKNWVPRSTACKRRTSRSHYALQFRRKVSRWIPPHWTGRPVSRSTRGGIWPVRRRCTAPFLRWNQTMAVRGICLVWSVLRRNSTGRRKRKSNGRLHFAARRASIGTTMGRFCASWGWLRRRKGLVSVRCQLPRDTRTRYRTWRSA